MVSSQTGKGAAVCGGKALMNKNDDALFLKLNNQGKDLLQNNYEEWWIDFGYRNHVY
jgi:hypothetical protein